MLKQCCQQQRFEDERRKVVVQEESSVHEKVRQVVQEITCHEDLSDLDELGPFVWRNIETKTPAPEQVEDKH